MSGKVKIPRDEWPAVAQRADAGESYAEIAAEYGTTSSRVGQIVRSINGTPPRDTITPEERADIERCVDAGEATGDIAARYGITPRYVRVIWAQARDAKGLPRPQVVERPLPPGSEAEVVKLLFDDGETISAVARRYGVSHHRVRKVRDEHMGTVAVIRVMDDEQVSRLWRLLPDNLVSIDQLQAALDAYARGEGERKP